MLRATLDQMRSSAGRLAAGRVVGDLLDPRPAAVLARMAGLEQPAVARAGK